MLLAVTVKGKITDIKFFMSVLSLTPNSSP